MLEQNIVKQIKDNIDYLVKQYRRLFTKEEFFILKKAALEIQKEPLTLEKLEEYNQKLLPYFARAWALELTDFSSFQIGAKFKFVITCPTVHAEDFKTVNRDFYSASLVTSKHMTTFNKINYGLVCSVDANNLLAVSQDDSHSVISQSSEKINGYYYAATTKSGQKIYTKKALNSLKLPHQIEMEMIKENIKINGDFIINRFKTIYSDITLDSATTKFLGVILFEPYTEFDYKEACTLAQLFHLDLKIIPKALYYEKLSITKISENKHYYNITDLDTILFLLSHLDDLKNEYSNLIFESFYDLVNIKDENNLGKISINRKLNVASIYLPNDNRYFKIDYSGGLNYCLFFIDNVEVSMETFKNELMNMTIKNNLPNR